jgi:hypothetical protein
MRMLDPKYTRVHPEVYQVHSAADVVAYAVGNDGNEALVSRHAPFGGGKPICEDVVSDTASTISNPDRWNNNFAKKMLDMQFNFSCGPLRVSQGCPEHWDRLHATHKTLMPLPGGRLELFKERVPHRSDEELAATLSGPNSMAHARKKGPADVKSVTTRRVDTPLLKELLQATFVAPLPQKENPDEPKLLMQRRKLQESGSPVVAQKPPKSCDSVFSCTTVASRTSLTPSDANLSQKKPPASCLSASPSQQACDEKTPSAVSSSSRVSRLRDEIGKERSLTAVAMEHIRAASVQLDTLEQVLHMREQNKQA